MCRPSPRLYASIPLALILAACATPEERVRVDQIEGALPDCRTFAWHSVTGDAASFSDQRVKAAVMAELKEKGYQESVEKPDCKIAYRLTAQEIPKAKPGVGVGVGGGSRGMGGGVGISIPIGRRGGYDGTFALDIIDAMKNAQVWTGSLDAELEHADPTDEEARALAKEVLSAYPNAR